MQNSQSLKKATIRGLFWSLFEGVVSRGLRFIIGIVLARLLVPEMFGLVAMLMIFITLGEIFVDSGFGAALIQKHNITELEICTVFYFNMLLGLISATILFISAPGIAAFYNQPDLIWMARALSSIFIFDSFGMVQSNLLVKRVDFKSRAKLAAIANFISGMLGIAMAIMGCGVWSLVMQQISTSGIRNLLYWFYGHWRPHILFSINVLGQMLRFSISILASGILNRTSESVYYMIIGKIFSTFTLGIFSRANQLQGFPSTTLAILVGRVAFPVFSKLQHSPLRLKRALRNTLTMLSFLIFPIMIGIIVVAKPLILVILTEKWAATIPYLQLLAFVGMSYPLDWIRQRALQAIGRPDLSLRVEIVKKVALFVSIAIMWYFGIYGIIAGMIFASLLSFSLSIKYTALFTRYSTREQLLDMLPYLIISIIMGVIASSVGYLLDNFSPLIQLFVQCFVGFFSYVCITWLFRLAAIMEIMQELQKFQGNKQDISLSI
jgi:teichuronic acid exporter